MKISTVAGALMVGAMNLPLMVHAADDDGLGLHLYGVIDAGVATTHVSGTGEDKGSKTGTMSGGLADSLWGLKGGEDLGDGWSARFQLESGFLPTTGEKADDDVLFNFNAWVGLANDNFGELRLGRQDMAGKAYGSELELGSWKDMGMGALLKASDNYQFSNVISYYTPSYDGFQAGISYSFDADNRGGFKTSNNNRAFSLGLKYDNGPLLAVATWDQLRLGLPLQEGMLMLSPINDAGKPQALQLGVSYDFEVVKVSAAWSRQRNGYVGLNDSSPGSSSVFIVKPDGTSETFELGSPAFLRDGTVDAYLLGVSVPVGQGAIVAQWSLARPNWDVKNEAGELLRKNAQVMTLGYTYDMSPRTTLYAFGGYGSNYTPEGPFDSENSHMSRFGMGISHRF